jgi:hypothetical protein
LEEAGGTALTIHPESASYPILGAANACGVEYGLALAYVEANKVWYGQLDPSTPSPSPGEAADALNAICDAYEAIEVATTKETAAAFRERINAALEEGRIYWPFAFRPPVDEATPLPDRIEEGGDDWDGKAFDPDMPVEPAKWPS